MVGWRTGDKNVVFLIAGILLMRFSKSLEYPSAYWPQSKEVTNDWSINFLGDILSEKKIGI